VFKVQRGYNNYKRVMEGRRYITYRPKHRCSGAVFGWITASSMGFLGGAVTHFWSNRPWPMPALDHFSPTFGDQKPGTVPR
jgi:hypothetical protein